MAQQDQQAKPLDAEPPGARGISGGEHNLGVLRTLIQIAALVAALITAIAFLPLQTPSNSTAAHTMLEVASTAVALVVGLLSLMRYSTRYNFVYLAVAIGFLGASLLDGYHAIVISSGMSNAPAPAMDTLVSWSWTASRGFLSVMLLASLYVPTRVLGASARSRRDWILSLITAVLCLAAFSVFAFAPLPPAYFPDYLFPRPTEYVPAAIFGLALIGHTRRALKNRGDFHFWLVAALVLSIVAQVPAMARSASLFDLGFDLSHSLKLLSYIMVLVGLLHSVARAYRDVADQRLELSQVLHELSFQRRALDQHAIVSVADEQTNILYANEKYCDVSGYTPEELIGTNHLDHVSERTERFLLNDLLETIKEGKTWQGELVHKTKDGEDYWVQASILPYQSRKGDPLKFISIQTDVTSDKRRSAELVIARRNAENASRAKTEFLASMSHELRTPLNAILGYSQFLQLDGEGVALESGKKREYVAHIISAGEHLLRLVNQVLDLARIENDESAIDIGPVKPGTALRDCLDQIRPMANSRHLTIADRSNIALDTLVIGDQLRLKQVLLNLLSNAVKYNVEQGRVSIDTWTAPSGKFFIAITDTGLGIPDDERRNLFKLFQRLGDNALLANESSGVGLYVTKLLVDRMNGGIDFVSLDGIGSCFIFWLPSVPENAADGLVANSGAGDPQIDLHYSRANQLVEQILGQGANAQEVADLIELAGDMITALGNVLTRADIPPVVRERDKRASYTELLVAISDAQVMWDADATSVAADDLRAIIDHWWQRHMQSDPLVFNASAEQSDRMVQKDAADSEKRKAS